MSNVSTSGPKTALNGVTPESLLGPNLVLRFMYALLRVLNGEVLMVAYNEKLISPHLDYAALQADFHGMLSLTQAWDLPLSESRHGIINVGHSLSVRPGH